jgi:hypothetical protein
MPCRGCGALGLLGRTFRLTIEHFEELVVVAGKKQCLAKLGFAARTKKPGRALSVIYFKTRELGSKVAALALATPRPVFFAYEEGRCAGHQAVLVRVVRQSLQNLSSSSKVLQPNLEQ